MNRFAPLALAVALAGCGTSFPNRQTAAINGGEVLTGVIRQGSHGVMIHAKGSDVTAAAVVRESERRATAECQGGIEPERIVVQADTYAVITQYTCRPAR